MDIAGGLYRELCDLPHWNALFGSGGRAAAASSSLSEQTTLHTYCQNPATAGLEHLEKLGIVIRTHSGAPEIAFAYFHPLSSPHMQPSRETIRRGPPIHVAGEVVLRFGFVEGEAVVEAERAIYDPQTRHEPEPFAYNGSRAKRLAVVLNELEVQAAGRSPETADAVATLMDEQNVAVVVVKRGARGALVFERGASPALVPAYRSDRVFKIGTGDVFSSIFAHHWGERRASAREAADLASRAVATYCNSRELPPSRASAPTVTLQPAPTASPGSVLLLGKAASLGSRWLMEEARFRLNELGVEVHAPGLDDAGPCGRVAAVLILSDGLHEPADMGSYPATVPTVILCEDHAPEWLTSMGADGTRITDDFTSAVYFSAWAAASPLPTPFERYNPPSGAYAL